MNPIKIIAKNTAALALMNIITLGLGLIFTISLARYFGDVGFGKYSFAIAFTSLFAILLDLGFNQLTIREVARNKTLVEKYMANILVIKVLLSILFIILIVIAINLMNYPPDTKIIVYIFGAYLILKSFSQFFRAIFHAFEKMEYNSLLSIIEKIVIVSIGLILLFLGYNLIQVVSVYLIGGIVNVILSVFVTIKKFTVLKFEVDFNFWKSSFISAIPISLTVVFVGIYDKIDTIMLSMIIGDEPVGWYNAAYLLVGSLSVIPGVFLGAIYPVLSRFYVSSIESLKLTYEKSFRYLFIIGFPIGIGTTLLADKIIFLIYGDEFIYSIIALQILIWMFVITCCDWIMGIVLQSINKQNVFAYSMGICAVFNVIANLFFIPKFSYIGASLTTIATSMLSFILLYYYTSKYLYKLPLIKIIHKPIVAGFVMGIALLYIKTVNLFIAIIIASIVYFTMLVILKETTNDDLRLIKSIIRKDN